MLKYLKKTKTKNSALRRKDLLSLALFHLGFSFTKNALFRLLNIPVARILAFHDVPINKMDNFRNNLEVLKRLTNVISFDQFYARKMSVKKINIIITFDDGYRSWHDYVLPTLKRLGLHATFFVSSGFVGINEEDEINFVQNRLKNNGITTGCLNIAKLRRLSKEGFGVGGHTVSHVNLSELNCLNKIRKEIVADKLLLEKMIGKKVDYFAYPFGIHYNPYINLKHILQDSGYKGAVTIVPGYNNSKTDKFLLHRDLVDSSLSQEIFTARFMGNTDGVIFIKKLLKLQRAC